MIWHVLYLYYFMLNKSCLSLSLSGQPHTISEVLVEKKGITIDLQCEPLKVFDDNTSW